MASASPSRGIKRALPSGPSQAMAELDVPKSMPSVPAGEDIMGEESADRGAKAAVKVLVMRDTP
jgi:hypothetical protein